MTSIPPNADELVSAYLDDEATPEEIAIVESNAELMMRVEALRGVVGLMATAPAPMAPVHQKETQIAAALDAFDALFVEATSGAQVPTPVPAPASIVPATTTGDHEVGTVTSLRAARERRRPRRFNTGVIAAAAAALLLVVGLAALNFGRSSTDGVAETTVAVSSETSDDTAAASAPLALESDAEEATDDADAPEIEESLATEDAVDAASASAPEPTPAQAAPSEVQADEAAEVEDFEEASDEEASSDVDSSDSASSDGAAEETTAAAAPVDESEDNGRVDFFLGQFADEEALKIDLESRNRSDLRLPPDQQDDGLFPSCQSSIAELATNPAPTLVGRAVVAGDIVEVHLLTDDGDRATFYLVRPGDECAVVTTLQYEP